jgi:hypothetical protein
MASAEWPQCLPLVDTIVKWRESPLIFWGPAGLAQPPCPPPPPVYLFVTMEGSFRTSYLLLSLMGIYREGKIVAPLPGARPSAPESVCAKLCWIEAWNANRLRVTKREQKRDHGPRWDECFTVFAA